MSIETLNFLLSKYYEDLTATQYLYQNELANPSTYPSDSIEPRIRYSIEIDVLKKIIGNLEKLKEDLKVYLES